MRIREKCYISLGDGKVTVLNEAGEETCLNDFTDKEAQAKDMLLEIKRLRYLPESHWQSFRKKCISSLNRK